jgi:hypothetical protein
MMLGLSVDNHEARADGEGGKLIDRVAARAPVRELLLIEALGHTRVPFAAYQPDHRGGVELSAIRPRRAAVLVYALCSGFRCDGELMASQPNASLRDRPTQNVVRKPQP